MPRTRRWQRAESQRARASSGFVAKHSRRSNRARRVLSEPCDRCRCHVGDGRRNAVVMLCNHRPGSNARAKHSRLVRLLALGVVCSMQAGCGSTSATGQGVRPQLHDGRPLFRSFDYESDNGNLQWRITHWVSHGSASARAIAKISVNTCTPACAAGAWIDATTKIALTGRFKCDGLAAYARFRVLETSNSAAAPVGSTFGLAALCQALPRNEGAGGAL